MDRQDIADLAKIGAINIETLRQRYEEELRPNFVGRVERIDLTLQIWTDIILEASQA